MQEIQMSRKAAAYKIHMDILAAGEVAAEAFSTFCRLLKTMRDDKLYQELEYSSFDAYCENAVGIKQSMAYGYIKAYEDFGDDNSNRLEKLGIKKLRLLGSVPEESREEFMTDKNLEEMTTRQVEAAVKEWKAKLSKTERELQKTKEWADKQARYADEHMMRARQAEKEAVDKEKAIQSLRLDKSMKEKEVADLRQQLDQANRNSDPAKVQELGQIISEKQQEIEKLKQQLHDKPIEVASTEIVEKEVIPDEIASVIRSKITDLYAGIALLSEKEVSIFIESTNHGEHNDIHTSIDMAINVLNKIDRALYEAASTHKPDGHCGDCAYANMDGVTDEQLDDDKTLCTVTNQVVDFMHSCDQHKSFRGE